MTLIKTGHLENYSVITSEIRLSSLLSLASILTDFLECQEPAEGGRGGEQGRGEGERKGGKEGGMEGKGELWKRKK